MAKVKNIKDVKQLFKFVGTLKEFSRIENEDKTKNSSYELKLEDKEMESEVSIRIWEGNIAKYWDFNDKKMVEVTSNIQKEMKSVRDNATGSPVSYKLKGAKEIEVFTNDEFIELVKNIKKDTKVKVEGNVTFQLYNGRVIRNYNINSLTILTSKDKDSLGFRITTPVVMTKETLGKLKVSKYVETLPILVKSKLDSGKGYRASNLGLDIKYIFNGQAKNESVDKVNEVLKMIYNGIEDSEFYIMSVTGRLKSGSVTRKQTIDDLNPMEVAMLKLKGEEALKEKIASLEEISEYFDDLILEIVDFINGKFCEPIKRSELNLPSDELDNSEESTNPLLASIQDIMNNGSNSEEKDNKEPEEVSDSLESLVKEEENKQNEQSSDDDDEFPFN